jgi:hypothetical protein
VEQIDREIGMAGKRIAVCVLSAVTVLFICTFCHSPEYYRHAESTAKYGEELQAAYEDYTSAVVIAYEKGDTSHLQDAATGYALKSHLETTGSEGAKSAVEWWKVEVVSITVNEYLTDTAEILVGEQVIGDISDEVGRMQSWICKLQKADGKWKVSSCGSVPDR